MFVRIFFMILSPGCTERIQSGACFPIVPGSDLCLANLNDLCYTIYW